MVLKGRMIQFILCIGLSFFWFANVFATTDFYVSVGTAEARYSESIGRQNADMTGTEQSLSVRNLNSIGSIDIGLDVGTLKLDGASKADQADFDGNYINFISGVSFSLYPSWIEYYLDIGYRLGLGKLKVQRFQSTYTFNAQMSESLFNELDNKRIHGIIFKAGIKLIASAGYLIGANYESKGKLVDQSSLLMRPRVHSSNSVTFSLGYRFGGNNVASSTGTPAGRTNYSDPCRLFGACN